MADLGARCAMAMRVRPLLVKHMGVFAALSATLMMGACAQLGDNGGTGLLAGLESKASPSDSAAPSDPHKAVEYWGQEYTKDPRDLDKALAFANSLKTIGEKARALAVLQQVSLLYGADKRLASDYGRLALEMDQISVAEKLLEVADDPGNPDWRVITARGTVLAKQGRYHESIAFYERALALKPDNSSIKNNLALAYTMGGDAEKGEQLLRQASAAGDATPKMRQNLALVLGLQGKYDEATKVGSADEPAESAKADTELLRKIVRLDPKPMTTASVPTPAVPPSAWMTQVADTPTTEVGALKPATVDAGYAAPEPHDEKVAASPDIGVKLSTP